MKMGIAPLGMAQQTNQRWRLRPVRPLHPQPSDGSKTVVEADIGRAEPMEENMGEEDF